MQKITVGLHLVAQEGELVTMRRQWIAAEELGVDRLWTSDHLNAVLPDAEFMNSTNDGAHSRGSGLNVFEGATVQAAMAATTERAEIGCIVHSNGYRNPNMTAFIANTIDHLSGGRFILGVGSGFFKDDYDAFGFEYGTQRSRSEALARDVPVMLDRLTKVIPPPTRKIPLLIASMGKNIGLPLVARHANLWHAYGPFQKLQEKTGQLRDAGTQQGRDADEIEFTTYYMPRLINGPEDTLENLVAEGFRHIILVTEGPDWDLGEVREALQWRDALVAS